jgi:hypothetical protein
MSASSRFPRQIGAEDAGPQPTGRASGSCNSGPDVGSQFPGIPRCRAGRVLGHLGPYKFGRIQLWCRRREVVDPETGMTCQERFDLLATMDWVLIPDHHDRARNAAEEVFQKEQDLVPRDGGAIGLQMQLDPALLGADAQRPNQVQPLVVLDAGANRRRLPTRGPRPFERRD